ncbi:hypothetical protein GCM10027446_04070 [Angustibacter peucedani]
MGTAAGAVLALVLLAGCGGGGSSDTASSGAAVERGVAGPSQPGDSGGVVVEKSAGDSAGGSSAVGADGGNGSDGAVDGGRVDAAAPAVTDQRVIRTADMAVRTKDVTAAAARVRTVAEAAKGFVADEKTTSSPPEPGLPEPEQRQGYSESVLTLRVPTTALDRVMGQVAETGTVLSRNQSSEDVSSTYVDVRSRVSSQTASVERVRALLARAANLGQVVQIESELSRREADLESLQAQLKSLEDRTALSTLTVSLTPPTVVQPTPPAEQDGFLAGLEGGWSALVAALTVLLTVLGALLPFAVVAALVGVPAYRWWRRHRASAGPGTAAAPVAPQPQPAP